MNDNPSTLVLAAGSLGDCLLTLPALQALQARGPVRVAGTAPFRTLGARLLGVEKVSPLEDLLQALYSPDLNAGQDPLAGVRDIHILFKDRDEKLMSNIAQTGVKGVHIPGATFQEFLKEGRWAAEYWLETVLPNPVPLEVRQKPARLGIGPSDLARGRELLGSLGLKEPLVLHPGSGSPDKNAPLSFFKAAAERTHRESGRQVLVIWGEAEEGWIGGIRDAFHGMEGVRVLDQVLPLQDLACLLSVSAAYLGNDSGVTQLASASGLRTFAVFHSTDSRVWAPQEAIILEALKGSMAGGMRS